jgi:hypothetical protein
MKMKTKSNFSFLQRFPAVAGYRHPMSSLFQQSRGQALGHGIVLREPNA